MTTFRAIAPVRVKIDLPKAVKAAVGRAPTIGIRLLQKTVRELLDRMSHINNYGHIYLSVVTNDQGYDILFLEGPTPGQPHIRLTIEKNDLRANPKIPHTTLQKIIKKGYARITHISRIDIFGRVNRQMEGFIRYQVVREANLSARDAVPAMFEQTDVVTPKGENRKWVTAERKWAKKHDPKGLIIAPRADGSIFRIGMDSYEIGLLEHLLYEAAHTHLRKLAETQPEIDLRGMAVARTSIQTVSDFFNPSEIVGQNMLMIMPALLKITKPTNIHLKINPVTWEVEEVGDRNNANVSLSTLQKGLDSIFNLSKDARKLILDRKALPDGIPMLQLITGINMSEALYQNPDGIETLKKLAVGLNVKLCEGLLHSIWQQAAKAEKEISPDAFRSLEEELHDIANRELSVFFFRKVV